VYISFLPWYSTWYINHDVLDEMLPFLSKEMHRQYQHALQKIAEDYLE
jgi:hypothetical protein